MHTNLKLITPILQSIKPNMDKFLFIAKNYKVVRKKDIPAVVVD
jgi:hypothetical protein